MIADLRSPVMILYAVKHTETTQKKIQSHSLNFRIFIIAFSLEYCFGSILIYNKKAALNIHPAAAFDEAIIISSFYLLLQLLALPEQLHV